MPIRSVSFERRTAAIAGRQRGRVSRRQLLAVGISSSTISRLLDAGYLWAEHPGVYAVGHRLLVPGARETSALLALRPGAYLSRATALRWWGIHHLDAASARNADAVIHVTVPGNGTRGPEGVVVHRSTILTRRDLRHHDGLPVLSPARALLDLAAVQPGRELERAHDEAVAKYLLHPGEITELLGRAGRHPGRAALTALVAVADGSTFTRSEAEERFLALVREAGLPAPLVNAHRHGYEIDFRWPEQNLSVEIDGFAYHRTRAAFERDRRRDAELAAAGITVIRITWRQLTAEPLGVASRVAGALAQRSAR